MTLTERQQPGSKTIESGPPKVELRSERTVLSEKMTKAVHLHFPQLSPALLASYKFERYKAHYPKAKSEVEVFDSDGALVFQGREFHSGTAVYWRPSRVSVVPASESLPEQMESALSASVARAE